MALWVVGASFRWKDGITLRAGKVLDDRLYPDVQQMISKGAMISPQTSATSAAAAIATQQSLNGAGLTVDQGQAIAIAEAIDGPVGVQGPSLDLTSGGTIVVPAAQYQEPSFAVTGTLPSNTILVYPTSLGPMAWTLDASALNFNAFNLTLQVNGNNWATVLTAQGVVSVYFNGVKFYGGALTP